MCTFCGQSNRKAPPTGFYDNCCKYGSGSATFEQSKIKWMDDAIIEFMAWHSQNSQVPPELQFHIDIAKRLGYKDADYWDNLPSSSEENDENLIPF